MAIGFTFAIDIDFPFAIPFAFAFIGASAFAIVFALVFDVCFALMLVVAFAYRFCLMLLHPLLSFLNAIVECLCICFFVFGFSSLLLIERKGSDLKK